MSTEKRNELVRKSLLAVLAVFLTITSGIATANASQPAQPKWPQNFVLQEGAETSFIFVVEKPGPVVVTVQWGGPPVLVSLIKPNGGTVDQQGMGSVTINYVASAFDVQTGTAWGVRLRCPQQFSKTEIPARQPLKAQRTLRSQQPSKTEIPTVRQPLKAQGTLIVQHPFGTPNLLPVEQNVSRTNLQRQAPAAQIINDPDAQSKITVEPQIPVKTPEDSFKLGNKTFEKKDKATEEMAGASKGFADKQTFEDKIKGQVDKGVGGIGGGTSLEDASKQFGGVGNPDLPGQNKGGVIFDDGKGTGPKTGGLADHAPGPKDAAGGGGGYPPEIGGEGSGFLEIDSMGGITAGVKGGVSGSNWGASGGGSYNFGGKSWNAHGEGSYGGAQVGGSMTGGANQGTKGSVSGSYKGVGTNSNQIGGLIGGSSGAEKNKSSSGDYSLHNRTPVDPGNTEQGVKESKGQEKKGDYNTKEDNNDNQKDKPPKEGDGTAVAQPTDEGQNDTGGSAKGIAKAKAAARKFTGDTGGMGETGWGNKPGANDAQRQTIRVKKANNEAAAVLGLEKKDKEGDPNSVNTQSHGPGASQGVSTDKEILSPTTQPK